MKKEIKNLEEMIKYHKALYYQGRPEITDAEYDKLEEKLKKLDINNPVLQIVGTEVQSKSKISHSKKMLSLEKTYKMEDLVSWCKENPFVSVFKFDGVSGSIVYQDGHFKLGKTRGDGSTGEDVTEKVRWISNVPDTVSFKSLFEVRGEIVCTEEDFVKLSDEMEKIGLNRPTSQRNIVAGLLGRKENLELNRYLKFIAFDFICENKEMEFEHQKYTFLHSLGFEIPEFQLHKNIDRLEDRIEEAKNFMSEGSTLIDGLVFILDDIKLQEKLGETSHHPRYKMAFKFEGLSKKTKIEKISWQVSRNGILTPVAQVEPVEISNAMISNVTLHNYGMVKVYNLKSGDEIEIIRSGEVIPKFMGVIKSVSGEIEIPKVCPSCGNKVEIEDIRLICNNKECPAIIKESILNFVQKIGIEDLSSKRLEALMEKKLINNIPDLYKITIDDLLTLEKTKEKLANKIFNNIQKTKEVDIVVFLSSLGISGGAFNKCEKIVNHGFNTLEKLKSLKVEDLMEIESFAEKSATEFLSSFNEKIEIVEKLESYGFKFSSTQKSVENGILSGLKICITGELSIKRSEMETIIKSLGGQPVGSVSSNTSYLLTNEVDSTSSKYKKAKSLKVPIITEEEFNRLYGKKS